MVPILQRDTLLPCNYNTQLPADICSQDCGGVPFGGRQYDRCGVCGGDGSSCKVTATCPILNCTICCGCDEFLRPVLPDLCGKCGGDNSTCQGCDRVPFSGRLTDQCGVCGGDGSTCTGCDGGVHSEKVRDLCGVCEGGNRNRDVCGVCVADNQMQGATCAGCDGVPFRFAHSDMPVFYVFLQCVFLTFSIFNQYIPSSPCI